MDVVYSIYYDHNTNTFEDDFNSSIDVYKLMSVKDIIHYKKIGGTYYTEPNESNVIYEIEFPIRDTELSFSYDPYFNMLFDEYGHVMYNIFHFISPIIWSIFKEKKESMSVKGVNGETIELLYDDTW